MTFETPAEDSAGATDATEAATLNDEGKPESAPQEDGEQELLEVYDIDGEEVDLKTIKAWKSGHMKDADYTQKTQALANDRKSFDKQRETFQSDLEALTSLRDEIEQMVMGDVNLDELLEEDTHEYLKAKQQMDTRKSKFKGLYEKLESMKDAELLQAQRQIQQDLGWTDPEKQKADIQTISAYARDAGITEKEFSKITSPKIMAALLDAARYKQLEKSRDETVKKVKKAPKTPKPSATNSKTLKPWEKLYGPDS